MIKINSRYRSICLLFFIFSFLVPGFAGAYDVAPEFKHVWNDRPMSDHVARIDSEYASDYFLYQIPVSDEQPWLEARDLYQVSVGSVSGKEFAQYHRLNLQRPITDRLQFRLNWIGEGDYDKATDELYWGFSYLLKDGWRLGAFGNSDRDKAQNDVGLSVEKELANQWFAKFIYQEPDFQRNKRQSDGLRWLNKPEVYTVLLENRDLIVYHSAFLRYEPNSVRRNDTSAVTEDRKALTIGARGVWQTSEFTFFDYRIQGDDKKEIFAGTEYDSKRLMIGLLQTTEVFARQIRWGADFLWRELNVDVTRGMYSDLVPVVWYVGPVKGLELGVQVAWHDLKDEFSPFAGAVGDAIESRFNAKYVFNFGKIEGQESRLEILGSMDLDGRNQAGLWEGGSANLSLLF